MLVWERSLQPALLLPKSRPCSPCGPPEPAALTKLLSLFLHVAWLQLQPSVHPSFCFLQPHCLFPQRPLHEHCRGKGIQWPGCSWNAPGPASCGISRTGTPPSCPLLHFTASPTSQNHFLPNIQNKILPPTDPSSGSTGQAPSVTQCLTWGYAKIPTFVPQFHKKRESPPQKPREFSEPQAEAPD